MCECLIHYVMELPYYRENNKTLALFIEIVSGLIMLSQNTLLGINTNSVSHPKVQSNDGMRRA